MANNKKTVFKFFSLADHEEEEVFLRKKQNEGWKFSRFYYPGYYVFERCQPEDVIYRLDFNIMPAKEKKVYIQLFSDCGWEYLLDLNDWSYFRKNASEAYTNEEIFNDNTSKLELMQRVLKNKMLPVGLLFILIIIPQFFTQYMIVLGDETMERPFSLFLVVFFLTMFVLYSTMFIKFALRYYNLYNKTK